MVVAVVVTRYRQWIHSRFAADSQLIRADSR
jgi:hypothetical protein